MLFYNCKLKKVRYYLIKSGYKCTKLSILLLFFCNFVKNSGEK